MAGHSHFANIQGRKGAQIRSEERFLPKLLEN